MAPKNLDPLSENHLCKLLNRIDTYTLAAGNVILRGQSVDEIAERVRSLQSAVGEVSAFLDLCTDAPLSEGKDLITGLKANLALGLYQVAMDNLQAIVARDEAWCNDPANRDASMDACRKVLNRQRNLKQFLGSPELGPLSFLLSASLADVMDRCEELIDTLLLSTESRDAILARIKEAEES